MNILDGRTQLYQWDVNRKIKVTEQNVAEVHMCNSSIGKTYDVAVETSGSDVVAKIPDELLQAFGTLYCYGYITISGNYTKFESRFDIIRRNKPAGYTFTPTEQLTIQEIKTIADEAKSIAEDVEDRADQGEFNGITPTIGDNGNWYLGPTDTGKPSRGVQGYSPVRGTDYWTAEDKAEIVSDTAEEININPVEKTATMTQPVGKDADGKLFTEPSGGGTGEFDELSNRPSYNGNAMTHSTDIPEVKTTTWDAKYDKPAGGIPDSDLASVFLKNHHSLVGYATEAWVEAKGYITSLAGYATQAWVEAKGYLTEHQSLADYATKAWVEAKGYITSLSGYATEAWVEAKGYLTSHQSLAAYRTASAQDIIDNSKLSASLKGANNGVAELDATGKVPSSQLPSFVDDVLEYPTLSDFPTTGETGKIYIAIDTNKTYRWSGTIYTEISASIALGETSSTAYRGDRGKTAYDHSQNSTVHVTAEQKTAWNAKYDKPASGIPDSDLASTFLKNHQSLSAYSTTAQMNTAIAAHHDSSKQDTIADLATIRSGAAAGATALQTETDPVFAASAAHGISAGDISNWNGKGTYSKPSGGIPKIDLASAVQTSLGKADSALQSHQDISGKQDAITSSNKLAYSLISGTPTIPTVPANVSAFNNDSGYLTLATLPIYDGSVV